MNIKIETEVLIVGSGPAGGAMAALLSSYGIKNTIVTKYGWLADTPRAHITNQGTMQVLRDLGLEEAAKKHGTGQRLMANNVFCYDLAGEEFGRILSWGNHPTRRADYELASPTEICDVPQTYLEPILIDAAGRCGTSLLFNTEFLALQQDENGVRAEVKNRLTNETYAIHAKYLIGADGARSRVAEAINLPMEGEMGLSGSLNILFDADLTKYVAHRPSVLYWVLQPGARLGGVGAGVIRMVRPWNEWLAIWGYDVSAGDPNITKEKALEILQTLIGDKTVQINIRSISTWTVNNMCAATYSRGRVHCLGDAVHRHPPLNGLGSNTSIQDAYNLAWKLAFVLKGWAEPSLLDTYSQERQPVGKQIVARANKSIQDYPPIFEALGLLEGEEEEKTAAAVAQRLAPTEAGKARRRRLNQAIRQKNYEFNTNGVELNQRYISAAANSEGDPQPLFERDAELYYQATTWPGARLPHAWLFADKKRVSTLDLCGKGQFTLLTGIGGEAWKVAAAEVQRQLGVPVKVVSIGPEGCDAHDIYADWYFGREIEDDGCILVRPDNFVAWRAEVALENATEKLVDVMRGLLGR